MEPSCTNFSGWVSHSRHLPLLFGKSQIVIRNKLAEHWFGCGWGMVPQRMDLHQHGIFPRGSMSGRTKLPSLSLASPPVTEASTWTWLSYLSRPKVLLFGRDIKKVAFSLVDQSFNPFLLIKCISKRFSQHNGLQYWTETDPDPLPKGLCTYMFFISSDSFQVPDPLPLINEWESNSQSESHHSQVMFSGGSI